MTGKRTEPGHREILRRTSRSFAISIEWLPRPLRAPVEIAYLLARIGDTVADTGTRAPSERRALLGELRQALAGGPVPVTRLSSGDGDTAPAERALLERSAGVFDACRRLPEADAADVARVVDRLLATMQDEIERFGAAEGAEPPRALPDAATLIGYTEGIAGCVGEFWTRLVGRHAVALDARTASAMIRSGRRYGRGLQLVNILRDLPRDLRRGRCFLPADELRAAGLAPADLLDAASASRAAPVLERWQSRARRNLHSGLRYACRLPVRCWRLRAATALPAALGVRTLDAMERSDRRLDPEVVIRITRGTVKALGVRTVLFSLLPRGPMRLR